MGHSPRRPPRAIFPRHFVNHLFWGQVPIHQFQGGHCRDPKNKLRLGCATDGSQSAWAAGVSCAVDCDFCKPLGRKVGQIGLQAVCKCL
jgi:hypothetical protein